MKGRSAVFPARLRAMRNQCRLNGGAGCPCDHACDCQVAAVETTRTIDESQLISRAIELGYSTASICEVLRVPEETVRKAAKKLRHTPAGSFR